LPESLHLPIVQITIIMKSSSKKLLDQQKKEHYEIYCQAWRQLMIPLALVTLAILLLYYDENLVSSFDRSRKNDFIYIIGRIYDKIRKQ